MVKVQKWIFLIFFSLYPVYGLAKPINDNTHCYFLGSQPSFIIKFKNLSPAFKPDIQKLLSDKATFTTVRAMSGDAYIIFFQPKAHKAHIQNYPGCYVESFIKELIQELKSKHNIEQAEPNLLMHLSNFKSKSAPPIISGKQWNLLAPPGGIDAKNAFNLVIGNPHVITAVLDSGILPNASLTPNLLPGVTFNNNGSFSKGATPSCNAACSGYDHGTHVAGIVAASGRLAYGETIFGVAPNTKILPINVFTKFTNPTDCDGRPTPCLSLYTADGINAINWLNGYTFKGLPPAPYTTTVNMSFEGEAPCSTLAQQAINQLLIKNISIAVAAGNGNINAQNVSPANCQGVMAIAATSAQGYGASYSNYGSIVPFAAPGGDFPPNGPAIYSTIENGYGYSQGTSQAAPHVAGLGALLYTLDPTLSPNTLLYIIKNTTTPFPPGGPGLSCTALKPCGSGIINAYKAVLATMNQAPRLTWNPGLSISINSRTQATLQWHAAFWQPARATGIVYTVNLNGSNVPTCENIETTSCILTQANPKITNVVSISATDVRQIYGPLQSSRYAFTTFMFKGPILTTAVRNPLKTTQAFIYYSALGNAEPDAFIINGISGSLLTLDTGRSRFIIDNITIPKRVDNVSITAKYGEFQGQSNSISIPSIL